MRVNAAERRTVLMDDESERLRATDQGAEGAGRRSGLDRRAPAPRRRADRQSDDTAADAVADKSVCAPQTVRKYHFRSFEDRRAGGDRRCRSAPAAEEGDPRADDMARPPRQKE